MQGQKVGKSCPYCLKGLKRTLIVSLALLLAWFASIVLLLTAAIPVNVRASLTRDRKLTVNTLLVLAESVAMLHCTVEPVTVQLAPAGVTTESISIGPGVVLKFRATVAAFVASRLLTVIVSDSLPPITMTGLLGECTMATPISAVNVAVPLTVCVSMPEVLPTKFPSPP